jgi:hypothetical protein
MAQVVDPSMREALGSTPILKKKKKKANSAGAELSRPCNLQDHHSVAWSTGQWAVLLPSPLHHWLLSGKQMAVSLFVLGSFVAQTHACVLFTETPSSLSHLIKRDTRTKVPATVQSMCRPLT